MAVKGELTFYNQNKIQKEKISGSSNLEPVGYDVSCYFSAAFFEHNDLEFFSRAKNLFILRVVRMSTLINEKLRILV
jgi:hypothetical protein